MYRCEAGHISKRGERMIRVVIEQRVKQYSEGTTGLETVREVALCPAHALEFRFRQTEAQKGV
jgi:hypothetical protein